MKEGDIWLAHFRGTRYIFATPDRIYYQFPLSAGGQRIEASAKFPHLVPQLATVKGARAGRVYVTEGLDVLVVRKGVNDGQHGWFPYYVTTLEQAFPFPDFEKEFNDLEPGDVWPGFNFHAGSRYSISSQRWGHTLFWRLRQSDAVQPLTSRHPELRKTLIAADWRGGGFYVTDRGHVWKSTDKSRVNPRSLEKLKKRPDHVLRTVRIYFDYTERMLPVYLGKCSDRFEIDNYQGPSQVANDTEF